MGLRSNHGYPFKESKIQKHTDTLEEEESGHRGRDWSGLVSSQGPRNSSNYQIDVTGGIDEIVPHSSQKKPLLLDLGLGLKL